MVERLLVDEGDLKYELDQVRGMKFPGDDPRNAGTTPSQKTVTVQGPHYKALYLDDIFADLRIDFDYDGRAVGNITMQGDRNSGAAGKGLLVRARVSDEQGLFTAAEAVQPFAAVGIAIDTRSSRASVTTSS